MIFCFGGGKEANEIKVVFFLDQVGFFWTQICPEPNFHLGPEPNFQTWPF